MSAQLSRLHLFQRHLRSLVWVWVWVWDWIHSHTPPRTRSPSSRHPPFTHYPFSLCSLVCGGQPSPHKPRLVVSHSTCPPLSSSPHAHSFVLGTAVINKHLALRKCVFITAGRVYYFVYYCVGAMTSDVSGSHLPESLYGPCGCLRYHEIPTPKSKVHTNRQTGRASTVL